jgi:hypothetical protein
MGSGSDSCEAERLRRLQEGGDYKQQKYENNGLFGPICQHVNEITALSTSGIEPFAPALRVINIDICLERSSLAHRQCRLSKILTEPPMLLSLRLPTRLIPAPSPFGREA